MPRISVVVPVYRVEDYLGACLNSISKQTFGDYELILVDDGSPDRCGEMCERYAGTHTNVKVLHQKNAGLSAARNSGVKLAEGEFITFIDSDDVVAPSYLEYLYSLIKKYHADVSIAARVKFYGDVPQSFPDHSETDFSIEPAVALEKMCYGKYSICAWGKLYRRDLVEKFPYPVGMLFEDIATTHKIIGAAQKVAYGSRAVYYWRQRAQSITKQKVTEKHFDGVTAAKEQLLYMEKNYPQVVRAAQARVAMKCIDFAYHLLESNNKDRMLFQKARAEIKPILWTVLNDKNIVPSIKIRSLGLAAGYYPYLLLSRIYLLKKNETIETF